jgi:HJR/Mrr/RecB family endonuclease
MFHLLGYAVELMEYYDHGADLLLTKDGARTAVQAKRMEHTRLGETLAAAEMIELPL